MDGTLEEVWNNSHYQSLRKAMQPGGDPTYFCREHICPYYMSGKWYDLDENSTMLPQELVEEIRNGMTRLSTGPLMVKVGSDYRCNYRCIMCDGKTFLESQRVESIKVMERLRSHLPDLPNLILLSSGELFANKDLLDFMENLDREIHRRLNIYIMTNASMITENRWQQLKGLNVRSFMVSVDAATRETYEAIRINGKWDNLQEKLKFLQSLRLSNTISQWSINMTVMRRNSSEAAAFAQMAKDLGVDLVLFTWINSYTPELIHENFDWASLKKVVDQLKDPIFREEWVLSDNLKDWRRYYDGYQSNLTGKALSDETVEQIRFRVCAYIMERQYESLMGNKPARHLLDIWLHYLNRLDQLAIDGRFMAYEWLRRLFLFAGYQNKNSRDRDFVESLYRIILQRSPQDHEVDYWAEEVQNRQRSNILYEFLRSNEFWERSARAFRLGITDRKLNLIASLHLGIHEQCWDIPEFSYYIQKLQDGSELKDIIQELVMKEYSEPANPQNSKHIQTLFKVLFLRFPSPAEENAYLQTSMTQDYMIQRLMSTPEFQFRLEYAAAESASQYPQDDPPVKFA
jgi:molybdenum cofactor biosynthesis enzyme MoaA